MILVIFEAVEIFVSFATCAASIWFMFLHAECTGVDFVSVWVYNGEGTVIICG